MAIFDGRPLHSMTHILEWMAQQPRTITLCLPNRRLLQMGLESGACRGAGACAQCVFPRGRLPLTVFVFLLDAARRARGQRREGGVAP